MRYLSLDEILWLHRLILEQSGGADGIRDIGSLESAIAQPHLTFGSEELYPTLIEKASAIAFALVKNHPFLDGNKRIGHAAMETFLFLNGYELCADVEEQERVFLALAGATKREEFTDWLQRHIVERHSS